MKKIKLLLLAITLASCSSDDPEPDNAACKQITAEYVEAERAIEIYRLTSTDRQVLADMREDLKRLAELKDKTCN